MRVGSRLGHGNGNGKGDFFCLRWAVAKSFGYLGGFGTEAEPILPASNGEGKSVLLDKPASGHG